MAIVVKVVEKESGSEPVVNAEQDAPIVGTDVEWKEEGTINDGHEEAQPQGAPPPPATTSGSDGDAGETDSSDSDSPDPTGDAGQLSIPELPPVDAYDDDCPFDVDDALEIGAEQAPAPVGDTAPTQAESDGQGEEPSEAEAPTEQEPVEEAEQEKVVTDETQAALVSTQEMKSQGKTVSTEHTAEMVSVPSEKLTVEEQAKVRYSCGFTKNVGEFNSLRADVSIELPCAANATQIEKTYALAVKFVDSKLEQLYAQADVDTAAPTPAPEQVAPTPAPQPMLAPSAPPPPPA